MNKYMIFVFLSIIAFVIISIIADGLSNEKKENKIKRSRKNRGHQNRKSRYATNSIKKQLEDALNEKASVNKRYKVETMCIQAGYDFSYGEFILLNLTFAIIIPILTFIATRNFLLIILFAFIGYHIPGQYLKFIGNKRRITMEKQVGSFIRIILERYKSTKDMSQSIIQSLSDFKGLDPFYSILKNSVAELNMGKPIEDILDVLVRETGNKYLARFVDYYKMTGLLSSHTEKLNLLSQSYKQYEDNENLKFTLKEKISGPIKEAYVMVLTIPMFFLYQSFFTEGYLKFMLNDKIGQAGFACSVGILLGCVWFINAKLGAPID